MSLQCHIWIELLGIQLQFVVQIKHWPKQNMLFYSLENIKLDYNKLNLGDRFWGAQRQLLSCTMKLN